jgi:hypothetical protein
MIVLTLALLAAQAPAPATPPPPDAARAAAASPAPAVPDGKAIDKLADDERKEIVARLSREQLAEAIAHVSADDLLLMGQRALASLGTYKTRIVKVERVGGDLVGPQVMEATVREHPQAMRARFVEGPGSGRKLLYNHELRANDLRAKEGGILGIAGGIWIGIDNGLTRRETNHRCTDLGFGPLLTLLTTNFEKANTYGGYARKDEGFDAKGRYCLLFTAPPGAKVYAARTRVCIAPALGLPVMVESFDAKGMFERFEYEDVVPVQVNDAFFTPKDAGL